MLTCGVFSLQDKDGKPLFPKPEVKPQVGDEVLNRLVVIGALLLKKKRRRGEVFLMSTEFSPIGLIELTYRMFVLLHGNL